MGLKIVERMGLTIFAGGCRYRTDDGRTIAKRCSECHPESICERGRCAQELAALIASQWVRTNELLPPAGATILYLEYPPGTPAGRVHLGFYDEDKRKYLEQASAASLPENHVIAWMPVPEVPGTLHNNRPLASSARQAAAVNAVD